MPPQTSISEKNKEFWSESMLPAWFVTDENLSVVNTNAFGSALLQEVCGRECLDENFTFAVTESNTSILSLWEELLSPGEEGLKYIEAALGVIKRHREILANFNPTSSNPEQLMAALSDIENEVEDEFDFIKVNKLSPQPDGDVLQLGIKVAPLEGLRLKNPATVEDNLVEYVDVVIGYRLSLKWKGKDLQSITFCGIQPAFHDCSSRRQMTQKFKEAEQKNVAMLISHALKTPINILINNSRLLKIARDEDSLNYYRKIAEKMEDYASSIYRLTDLIVFVNSYAKLEVFLCYEPTIHGALASFVNEEAEPVTITSDKIREQVQNALQSIIKGKNEPPRNQKKVKILAGLSPDESEVSVDYQAAVNSILDVKCLESAPPLYFGVKSRDKESVTDPEILAVRIKTVLLDLMLVELVLNAVKYADRNEPEVKCIFDLSQGDALNIHIRNNGDESLTPEKFENALERIASKPGEKRYALGLHLNRIVAQQLGWNLHCIDTQSNGTHLILSIPFATC